MGEKSMVFRALETQALSPILSSLSQRISSFSAQLRGHWRHCDLSLVQLNPTPRHIDIINTRSIPISS